MRGKERGGVDLEPRRRVGGDIAAGLDRVDPEVVAEEEPARLDRAIADRFDDDPIEQNP